MRTSITATKSINIITNTTMSITMKTTVTDTAIIMTTAIATTDWRTRRRARLLNTASPPSSISAAVRWI